MKNLITCLTVCVLSGAAFATTWTVDDDGKADFDNIQAAVDAASDGDEIIVMPGTYTGTGDEVVDMLGKAIWLHSSAGVEVTIIDGEGARRGILCENGETANTIIEGFTITNGYGSTWGGRGGGMYNHENSNPTLTNCTFTSNNAVWGGGMYNYWDSSPTLTNCTFTDNTANSSGGGMYNREDSNPTLTDCTFTGNNAGDYGGGMHNTGSSPILENCTLCSNTPNQISGDWSDEGGNTVAAICPVPGACCTNDGCVVSEQEDCNTFLGQWLGEETTCADNTCPTSCLGDINGNGQVDVNDLLLLIAAWGVCP